MLPIIGINNDINEQTNGNIEINNILFQIPSQKEGSAKRIIKMEDYIVKDKVEILTRAKLSAYIYEINKYFRGKERILK